MLAHLKIPSEMEVALSPSLRGSCFLDNKPEFWYKISRVPKVFGRQLSSMWSSQVIKLRLILSGSKLLVSRVVGACRHESRLQAPLLGLS